MRKRLWLFVPLFAALSCINQKDYKITSVDVSPAAALPIAFGSLSIQDLIKGSDSVNVKVDPNDVVYLAYSSNLPSPGIIRDLFTIPDKSINQGLVIPAGSIPAHSTKDLRKDSIVDIVDLGLTPAQLSEIDFKQGTINYSATWLPPGAGTPPFQVILTSTDFTSKTTGQNLSLTTSSSGSISLADYKVALNKNRFNLKMVVVLLKTSSTVNINANTSVSITFSMSGMDFHTIHGFFGDQTVTPPSASIQIGAFGSTLLPANVSFAQPAVTLTVINDYGVPCKVTFTRIEARKNAATLPLQLNPANPISINAPATLGTSATTSVAITNAKQVLDFAPSEIFYQLSARINQGLIAGSDFMADTSQLHVRMDVNVPLYGHATGITLRDTAKIDLSGVKQSQVKTASLKIDAVNELPLNAVVQLYLADAQNVILDSLLDASQTNLIQASTVNATGDLVTAGVSNKLLTLSSDKVAKIFTAKSIIIVAVLSTAKDAAGSTVDVKFKSRYTLQIHAGLLTDLNFNVKF